MKDFYEEINNNWSFPIPGKAFELTLMGYLLEIEIPKDLLENVSNKQMKDLILLEMNKQNNDNNGHQISLEID